MAKKTRSKSSKQLNEFFDLARIAVFALLLFGLVLILPSHEGVESAESTETRESVSNELTLHLIIVPEDQPLPEGSGSSAQS